MGDLTPIIDTDHFVLNNFWKGEISQCSSKAILFNGIAWHIISDVGIAIFLTILYTQLIYGNILMWAIVGFSVGGIVATVWIHVYAAFETGWRIMNFPRTNVHKVKSGWQDYHTPWVQYNQL